MRERETTSARERAREIARERERETWGGWGEGGQRERERERERERQREREGTERERVQHNLVIAPDGRSFGPPARLGRHQPCPTIAHHQGNSALIQNHLRTHALETLRGRQDGYSGQQCGAVVGNIAKLVQDAVSLMIRATTLSENRS